MTEVDLTGSENKTFNETTIKEGYNEVNFFSWCRPSEEADTLKYCYSHCE